MGTVILAASIMLPTNKIQRKLNAFLPYKPRTSFMYLEHTLGKGNSQILADKIDIVNYYW